jgi:ATP-dependent Lon protease
MATFEDLSFSVEDFCGTVRLFPLPNLVLFPHVMQPLHVFEPRYRELLEDALDGDRLIAMAVLSPGWENDYEGTPAVFPTACLGRVAAHCQLDDETYNVLLLGVRRVRLLRELSPVASFREWKVEVCTDCLPLKEADRRRDLQRRLREAFLAVVPSLPEVHEQLDQLLGGDVSLAVLTDVIGYMLDIDIRAKEALLAELSVSRRAEMLLGHLETATVEKKSAIGFPPQFSAN